MHSWLQNFAYHININAGIFVVAITASFVIAALTTSLTNYKSSKGQPGKR